tara:strand:- start:385 stop:585 length:201 start_codon:yes stop_codon:yes gene_type:complete
MDLFFGFFVLGIMMIVASFGLIVELGVKYEEFRDKKPNRDSDLTGAFIGFIIVVVLPSFMLIVAFS